VPSTASHVAGPDFSANVCPVLQSSLANLFAVRRLDGQLETVAVDWEQVGPASAGADISTLVFGTMRRCEFDAERATELDKTVFTGYVAGLREAGWQGRVEEIRLGFTAAVGLRWTVLAGILQGLSRGCTASSKAIAGMASGT